MTEATTRDPVSRVRYAFEPQGDDLIVNTWLEPGGTLPAHYHPRQEERWSVVEGKARFRLGDDEREIGPEDGEVVVAPGVVHGLSSASDREARLRTYVTPALGLQAFLEESAAAGRSLSSRPAGCPAACAGRAGPRTSSSATATRPCSSPRPRWSSGCCSRCWHAIPDESDEFPPSPPSYSQNARRKEPR